MGQELSIIRFFILGFHINKDQLEEVAQESRILEINDDHD